MREKVLYYKGLDPFNWTASRLNCQFSVTAFSGSIAHFVRPNKNPRTCARGFQSFSKKVVELSGIIRAIHGAHPKGSS